MKTPLFQPIKKLAKSISFVRNSISSREGSVKVQWQKNKCLYELDDNVSVCQLKPLANQDLISATLTNNADEKIYGSSNIKNSFMRTFVCKSGILAIALLIANFLLLSNGYSQTQTFTTTGAGQSFTVPAGVTSVTVQAWGGGGRGGARISGDPVALAGGGGGAYSSSILTVVPGTTYTVNVGVGSTTNTTTTASDSWFGSTATLLAKGGGSVADNSNISGAGGLASAGVGTTVLNGGNGAIGAATSFGGGGGSSAGTSLVGNFTNTTTSQRNGATAPSGGGNGGIGGINGTAGTNGTAPGGGGGGGYRNGFGTTQNPGNGANGQVVISWTCPNYSLSGTTAVTPICTSAGTSLITLTSSAAGLPVGTYTVTYSRSLPNATGLTATMTVTTAGTGTFTATGLTTAGNATISVTSLTSGSGTGTGTLNCTTSFGSGTPSNTITVLANNTAGAPSSSPTLCINTALTDITIATTGATGISNSGVSGANGLPAGVSATWAANTITISGTPAASGTFNYSIPLTGGCGSVNATGTITVKANTTVGTPSSSPTLCINTALTNITITTTSATGISNSGVSGANGLPAGVSATWASNTITISGTPTVSGTFNYSIPLTGGCGSVVNATGTITVTPANTKGVPSSSPTLCSNTALTNITIATTGATGISNSGVSGANGLPAGVSATWASNTITISGTPTASGTFNYSIPLTGGCGSVNATGTINVTASPTVSITGSSSICIGSSTTLSPTTGGTWVSNNPSIASVTNAGVVTAGSTAGSATFTFTSSATGCSATTSALTVDATCQVITLTQPNQLTATISGGATICAGQSTPITVTVAGGTAPYVINGVTQSGAGPFTINVSPTSTTTYDNTNIIVTGANSCTSTTTGSATIAVNAAPTITTQPANQTVTFGDAAANFSVTAAGTPAPTYQWQVNTGSGFTDISGQTSASLAIPNPTVALNGYQYQVIVTNTCSSVTSNDVSLTVSKATTTLLIINSPVTYNGSAQAATVNGSVPGTVTNILYNGSATVPASAGTYTVTADFIPADATNYSSLTAASAGSFVISEATPTLSVINSPVTYNGSAQAATVSGSVPGTVSNILYNGSATAPTTAGTYTIIADFTPADATNYSSLTAAPAGSFIINKATPTLSLLNPSVIYNGSAQTAFVSGSVAGSVASVRYNGSATKPVTAGTYAISANFTPADGTNYNSLTNAPAGNLIINKANATITVTSYSVTYDGNAHTATGTAKGVLSEPLTGLNLSGTTNTNAGTHTDTWTFTDATGNYNNASGTVNDVIGKANAVITVTPYSVTYDGNPHTATFTAVGVESPTPVSLTALMNISATTHTGAGIYTGDTWTFAGNSNYNPANGTVDNFIGKAASTIIVTGTNSFIYNSNPQGPFTSSVTGSTGLVTYSYSGTDNLGAGYGASATPPANAGAYSVIATVAPDNNYAGASSLATAFTINRADAYINVTPYNVTYDGNAHTATGAATGVLIEPLTGLDLSGTTHTDAGIYAFDTYKFIDVTGNYNNITDGIVGENAIGQANLTITANNQSKCVGQPFTFNGDEVTVVGLLNTDVVGGVTLTSAGASPSATPGNYDIVPGGATGTGLNNYNITYDNGVFTVIDNSSIVLSSAPGTDEQPVCINNTITDINYAIGGSGTGASITAGALPAGVTGSYSAGVFTISGTPTESGTFNYTVTTTGPCVNTSINGKIIVNANSTITLSSDAGTDGQTVCINNAIATITYAIGGGATDADVAGLPAGVSGTYSAGVFTITGAPTVSGTFNYTVTALGLCIDSSLNGTIIVNANSSISLSSSVASAAQTVCINNAIADITYLIDDGATGGGVTGLPAGVTGAYSAGVFTITGTPTESGTFNYTVTTTGPCVNPSLNGTITVNANSTISLSSVAGTAAQAVCINNAIAGITYAIGGGGDGAAITAGALPAGVAGTYNAGVFTITGTPTESGTFNYTVTTTGPCVNHSLSGTLTINANSTISLSSATGTDGQIVCINNAITGITYAISGGGNGASITSGALPSGITGSYNAGVFTISGTPTESGTFNYTVTTTGPCINVSLNGTITVNANSTISLSSAAGTSNQTVCLNNAITDISYAVGGGGASASITAGALPAGVTGSYSAGVFTITGTPTESGTFNYTVTTAGPCINPSLSGTITVNPLPVVNALSNAAYCHNAPGAAINFSSPATGGTIIYTWSSTADVGFGTSGTGNIPAYTAKNSGNSILTATITVTPHYTYNSVTCNGSPATFTITVAPSAVVNTIGNLTYCNNTPGAPIVFSSPTTGGTVSYSWSSSVNVGFGLNGNGNIPAFTATNNSFNPLTATVTVTPTLNGCTGSPVIFSVTINPNVNAGTISGSSILCPGLTSQLSTNGIAGGVWTSGNPSIASVVPATGLVTGHTPGSATIVYTVTGVCGASASSFTVSVNSSSDAGTISGPASVCVGSSIVLTSNGNSGGTWLSGSPSATVNSLGLVTGVAPGVATIYYFISNTCGSSFTSYNVTVNPAANAGTITGSSSMCPGTVTQLFTTGSGGTWSSSNTLVGVVDANGFVLGLNAGTTTISYTVGPNGCSAGSVAHFTLTVNPSGNAGTITGPANVCVNASILLSTSGSSGGTWVSGSPTATVNAFGLVTGVSSGSATIYYFVSNTCGSSFATFNVNVSPAANAGTISGLPSVCTGSTINLSSSGTPGGTWSSNNNAVAIVDVNGVVLGIGTGTATITYTVTSACATSSASATVTVNPVPNAGSVTGTPSVCTGSSTIFTSNGSAGGTWSSSNPSAATVNSVSGVVTGVAPGNTVITYTVTTVCGTANSFALLIVNPVLNPGTISGGSSVCNGATINLSSNGNSGGTWTSSNTAVATVDAATGVVTSVSPGNTLITYTVSNGCGAASATQSITVNAIANAGTVNGALSVCKGSSTPFTTTGTGGTWSSSNPAAATVNLTTGLVTGVAEGTSVITYTVATGCGTATASANITVNPLASAGTITGASAVCVGHPIILSSNISGGIWGSNSPAVATVNSSGQVSGLTAGTATITYTISTTCGSSVATFLVTVNSAPFAGVPSGPSTICVGSTAFFTQTGGATGGIWRSTKPAVATVDPVTGEVTAVSAGNTLIVYTVTNSCGSSNAAQALLVNSLPNAGTISGLSSVCAAASINLSASGDAGGTWTSNAPGIAMVDPVSGVVTGVAQGSATIIYTVGSPDVCGTSAATHLVTVNPLPNAGTISGAPSVCTGLSTTFTSSGSANGTWNSSNPSVASVNSATGVVIGVSAGNATITYSVTTICGTATASANITVSPVPNAGAISGASAVCIGSNIILSSTVSGGIWTSGTTSVATVDANTGKVTGVAAGNSTITYTVTTTCGTATATYTITVNPLPNAGTINGTTFLCTGSTTTLTSDGLSGGTWSSSNTSAATVNATSGLVTAVSAGTTTITYTVTSPCGTVSASAIVTIGNAPNAGTVNGVSTLCAGSTAIFTANGTGGGSWSSNNIAAATVDPLTGVVTGIATGSATITYTVSGTCGSSAASSNITISALPIAGLVSGSSTLCTGSVTTFTSSGTAGGSWSSNNILVATVNPATGVVTGMSAGSAIITYTVTSTCGIERASATVTVNSLPNSGAVSGSATVCVGSATAFTSTGNGGGTWSSNNPSAAIVNSVTGLVTGVAAGSATISYTVSGICGSSVASANITVNPLPNAGTVSGSSTVCVNSTTTFTSTGDGGGSWISSNTSIATVNSVTGVVTGAGAGSATITYKVVNGCGTANATHIITVNPLANAGVIIGSSTVCVGSTTAYTSDGLSGGVWASLTPSVATIDANGLITGILPGNAMITYTVTTPCGTATATSSITVIILPDAGTISGSSTVCVGSATPYASDGLSGGAWSSVTPSVASVDAVTGIVTGISAGNATITYTFTNSCGTSTATKTITVNPLANAGIVSGAATVCVGSIATFTSNGLVSGGAWSSSNTAAATVNLTTGVVTGVAAGNATITYTSTTPCGIATASANVVVVALPNAGTVSGASTVCVNSTTTYTSDGLSGGTWSSVTPGVATVDPNTGVVTGVSAGNATITYTFANGCGTASATKIITVNPLANAGIVSGVTTLCAGSIATFTSSGLAGGTWSSSNIAVATVNSITGVVSGVAAGNATITYTSSTPCGTATASANITVNPVLSAGVVSGASTLCIGSTTTYTSSGSTGGTWSSVTPSVATVNATTGVVTGISTGNATITYTVNGCGISSASKLIAVSLAANPGTISGVSSVCAGSSVTFTRSGGVSGGSWSSSDMSVATVSGSGIVTGVSGGTAVISYSVASGCGITSATKSITVGQAPTLSATNITVSTDLNTCSALVTLGSNITVSGATTLEYQIGFLWFSFPISATNTFYRGTTPVTVRATNSCGSVTRTFLVIVNDNTPPAITCIPNATRTVNGNSSRYAIHGHEFDAAASDGCGVASLIYSLSGATVEGFDNSNRSLSGVKLNPGTTTITWKATDVNGNVSTCSSVVTVNGGSNNNIKGNQSPLVSLQSNTKLNMPEVAPLTVKVAPNPTSSYFTLGFKSGSKEKIQITVTDIVGRIIEQRSDVPANSTLQLGATYHFGVYFAEIIQGKGKVTLRLIKGSQ